MLKFKICVWEFVQGPQTLCLFEPTNPWFIVTDCYVSWKHLPDWMKDADKTRGARPTKGVQRRTQQHKNLSLWRGCFPGGGIVLLESKAGLRVEEAPGAGDVISLSNGSEWAAYLWFSNLSPLKACWKYKAWIIWVTTDLQELQEKIRFLNFEYYEPP